jgi:hypothetical protein
MLVNRSPSSCHIFILSCGKEGLAKLQASQCIWSLNAALVLVQLLQSSCYVCFQTNTKLLLFRSSTVFLRAPSSKAKPVGTAASCCMMQKVFAT